ALISAGFLDDVIRQPDAGELPARLRGEEVAVTGAEVRTGRGTRAPAQDHLPAHEFSVVLAQRSRRGLKARIRKIGAGRPLPYIAEDLQGHNGIGLGRRGCFRMKLGAFHQIAFDGLGRSGDLPFELSGQPGSGPAGKGVSFVKADVAYRLRLFDLTQSGTGEL